MTNGGTGPYHSSLVLTTSGRGPLPPSIALVNPKSPNNVTVLLDNFFGRQFNSLNDVKIHRPSGNFLFTDPECGSIFRLASIINLEKSFVFQLWILEPFPPRTSHAYPNLSSRSQNSYCARRRYGFR